MRAFPLAIALATSLAVIGPAKADEVSDNIAAAGKLYAGGKLADAARELQFAAAEIQKRLSTAYAKTMPPAPKGWTAQEPESAEAAAMFGMGGSMVTRRYEQDGGDGQVTATLAIDNPMLQAMSGLFANPAMATQMGFERVRLSGSDQAMLQWKANEKGGTIMMVLGGRALMQLEGRNIDKSDVLKDMMRAWDLKKLREQAGL